MSDGFSLLFYIAAALPIPLCPSQIPLGYHPLTLCPSPIPLCDMCKWTGKSKVLVILTLLYTSVGLELKTREWSTVQAVTRDDLGGGVPRVRRTHKMRN